MSRYIDIGKVLKELRLNHKDVIYIDKRDTAKRIEKIQGIDIVRCKDCKSWKWIEWAKEYRCTLRNTAFNARADDFCSYGEREGE